MKPKLSKKLKKELVTFLQNHRPRKFSRRLRSMVFDYLRYESKAGTAPLHLHHFLWSLNEFFDLWETVAKEFPKKQKTLSPGNAG